MSAPTDPRTQLDPPWPLVELRTVTYTPEGDAWALDVTFTTAPDDTGPSWTYFTQLYADAALTTAVGDRVAATADENGDGTGAWSVATAKPPPLTPAATYWLAVVTVAPSGKSQHSDGVAIVRDPAGLVGGAFDGAGLDLTWRAPANAPVGAYRATVTTPGGVLYDETFAGPGLPGSVAGTSCARLDLSGVPFGSVDGPPTVTLYPQVVAGPAVATGPGAAAVFPSSAPVVTAATTDPATGQTTLDWTPAGAATGYAVDLDVDGLAATLTTTDLTLPLPDAVAAGAEVTATVTGTVGPWTGPPSAPFPLPTGTPQVTAASYDGATARASWTPVPGATGYTVTLLANGAAAARQSAPATATSTAFAFAAARADAYTVVAQAVTGPSSGPPSTPASLVTPALYLSSGPTAYVYPADTLALAPPLPDPPDAPDIVVPLPAIATTPPPDPVTRGPFTLSATGDAAYPCALTIGAGAWTFDGTALRTWLRQDYVGFLKDAEAATVTPAGLAVLQQAIARAMPQTFDETLYYAYGLATDRGYVDLRPGTVLRVASATYTDVGSAAPGTWYDGWSGGATAYFDLVSYVTRDGVWSVGADAFLARLVAGGALQVLPPPQQTTPWAEGGVADAADLLFPALRKPFLRLFFPTQLKSASGIGSTSTLDNFAIGGADTVAALDVLTPGAGSSIAYFRGRAVLSLCLRVTVNGVEELVPAGTTVGDVLDRHAARPPSTALPLAGVRLDRALGPLGGGPEALAAGATRPVRLDWGSLPAYAGGRDALDLPLLHGDRLTVA